MGSKDKVDNSVEQERQEAGTRRKMIAQHQATNPRERAYPNMSATASAAGQVMIAEAVAEDTMAEAAVEIAEAEAAAAVVDVEETKHDKN